MLTRHHDIGTIGYLGGIMSLPEPFTFAWGKMLLHSQLALCDSDLNEYILPEHASSSLHDVARMELVKRMRGDWLLMLDTDTKFEADFAARLVQTMYRFDVDVLTGIYSFKQAPHFPVLYMRNLENDKHEVIKSWNRETDIFPIDAAGGGCLLIRKRALDKIRKELREEPFARLEGMRGEDISFFRRCNKVGIQPYCAWKVEMVHLAYQEIRTSEHYDDSFGEVLHEYLVVGKVLVGSHGEPVST